MMPDLLTLEPLAWLVRGALLLVGLHVAGVVFRRRAAAGLAFYWRGAMLALLLLVPVTVSGWKFPAFWSEPAGEPRATLADLSLEAATFEPEELELAAIVWEIEPEGMVGAGTALSSDPFLWRIAIWSGWGLGAGWVVARWVTALWRRRRWVRAAVPVGPDDEWSVLLREVAAGARVPRLLCHPTAAIPCAWGLRRPTILVPASAVAWPRAHKRLALAHEFAHLRRGDPFWQTLSVLMLALHWANPLAWLAVRRWRLAEEQAADDAALAGAEPSSYAALLVACARHSQNHQLQPTIMTPHFSMAHPSTVPQRVERVLDPSQDRRPPGLVRRGLSVALLSAALVACLGLTPVVTGQDQSRPAEKAASSSDQSEIAPALEALSKAREERKGEGFVIEGAVMDASQIIIDKLHGLIVPKVEFDQVTVEEAVEFLRQKSRELDVQATDPQQKGINFILRLPTGKAPTIGRLSLVNVPLGVAVKVVADQAGLRMRIEQYAVIISPADFDNELVTRVFKVPPDFLTATGGDKRATADEILKQVGIPFPEQASAFFSPASSMLTVRNTAANLDLVANFVETLRGQVARMINLRAEFYRVPKADALALLDQLESVMDASAGVAKLREIAATSQTIKLLAAPTLHTRSGQRAKAQSGRNQSVSTDNKPQASAPEAEPRDDFRGTSFTAEATVGTDGHTLDVAATFVYATPPATPGGQPNIGSLTTSAAIYAGQTRLVGSLSGGEEDDSMILVFLKTSLVSYR